MKNILKKFYELSTIQKMEFIVASLLSLLLLVGIPAFAWFFYSNNLETMTQIKEPDNLDIRAGNFDPIINLELSNIDIEEMKEKNTSQYYVFSVSAGDYKIDYFLQLAYTRNIPFKYSLWKATQVETEGIDIIKYHPLDNPNEITYYQKGEAIELVALNADTTNKDYYGRELAMSGDTYYKQTYKTGDTPEIYAIPIYMQTKDPIRPDNKDSNEHDYFILELSWDAEASATNFSKWNKAENNKETDIIYISAGRTTG